MSDDKHHDEQLLTAFIQKPEKVPYYQRGLNKMQIGHVFSFKWHWSWWAFFFGWAFLLYRKAYLPALGAFIVAFIMGFIPFFGWLITSIVLGGVSPYFVLKKYHDIKSQAGDNEEEQLRAMQNFGGYHSWVVWVTVIFYALIFLFVFAAFLPNS